MTIDVMFHDVMIIKTTNTCQRDVDMKIRVQILQIARQLHVVPSLVIITSTSSCQNFILKFEPILITGFLAGEK